MTDPNSDNNDIKNAKRLVRKTNQNNEWEKEFDRQFKLGYFSLNTPAQIRRDFKKFVDKAVSATREEERERIREYLTGANLAKEIDKGIAKSIKGNNE